LGAGVGAILALLAYIAPGIEIPGLPLRAPWELSYLLAVGVPMGIGVGLLLPVFGGEGRCDRFIWLCLIISIFTPAVPTFLGIGGLILGIGLIVMRCSLGEEFRLVPTTTYAFLAALMCAFILALVSMRDLGEWVRVMVDRGVQFVLFLFLVNTVRTREHLRTILRYALLCAVASGIFATLQFVLIWYGVITFNLAPKALHLTSTPIGPLPRVSALFLHPNTLGGTMAIFGVVLLCVALAAVPLPWWQRGAMFVGGGFILLGALTSFSRGAWLAMASACALFPILRFPRWSALYGALLAGGAGVAFMTGAAEESWRAILSINAASADFRYYIAELAVEAIAAHPWLGLGMQALADFNNPFRLAAHNLLLQTASELGLPATGVMVAYFLSLFIRLGRAMWRVSDPWDSTFLNGLSLGLVVLCLHSQMDVFLYAKPFWFYLALVECGLLVCGGRVSPAGSPLIFARSAVPVVAPRDPDIAPLRVSG
jgi:O-antigen ligase